MMATLQSSSHHSLTTLCTRSLRDLQARQDSEFHRANSPSLYEYYPSNQNLTNTQTHVRQLPELRHPPIDPRKSRRYCTDFGLGRDQTVPPLLVSLDSPIPPSPLDVCNVTSTPLATRAETEGDSSDVSSHLGSLLFPQPPPFTGSIRLRRMHSSPLFASDEANTVKYLLKKRYGAAGGLFTTGGELSPTPSFEFWEGSDEVVKDVMDGDHLMPSFDQISRHLFVGATYQSQDLFLPGSDISSVPSGSSFPPSSSKSSTATTPTQSSEQDFAPLEEIETVPGRTCSPLPVPEISKCVDRLTASMQKLKTHDAQKMPANRSLIVPWEYQLRPRFVRPEPVGIQAQVPARNGTSAPAPPSRQKATHRAHLSVPLTGLDLSNLNVAGPASSTKASNSDLRSLGPPFHHHTTQSHSFPRLGEQERFAEPKSFINITPEQENRQTPVLRTRKEQLKKLMARASGILGWNKVFARKAGASLKV